MKLAKIEADKDMDTCRPVY